MVKVCHMTSVHTALDTRIFYKECITLLNAGYKVYLVAPGESFEVDGIRIVGMGEKPVSRLKRMSLWARQVYKGAAEVDADIYHFHDPELLPYGLKLKRAGKKVIFDSHEDTLEQIEEKKYIPKILRKFMKLYYKRLLNKVCGEIDAVISVTPHLTASMKKRNTNVCQIANYPIINENDIDEEEAKKVTNTIVFAGGVVKQWCHHSVLEAMAKFDDINYILCGNTNGSYLEQLKKYPAWNKVTYLGKIPFQEVQKYLKESSVGLAIIEPSNNTDGMNGTMGNTKIFEEMLAGLPVVCTNFKLWKEIVCKYDCGIVVDPNNIEEIYSAIKYLFENPNRAIEMGKNGKKAIFKEYNWNVEAEKLKQLYKKLM